jgi:hypothetical protein
MDSALWNYFVAGEAGLITDKAQITQATFLKVAYPIGFIFRTLR